MSLGAALVKNNPKIKMAAKTTDKNSGTSSTTILPSMVSIAPEARLILWLISPILYFLWKDKGNSKILEAFLVIYSASSRVDNLSLLRFNRQLESSWIILTAKKTETKKYNETI